MDKSGANKAGIDTSSRHLALLFKLGGLFLQIKARQVKYPNISIGSSIFIGISLTI